MRFFLKVCLFLAAISGCALFIVHEISPVRTLPAPPRPRPRQHFSRPFPKPAASNGGIFSDRNVIDHGVSVVASVSLACFAAFLLWQGITEYRDCGEWTAFVPIVMLAVIIGGLLSWMDFVRRDMMLIWPIVVSLVVLALWVVRQGVLDRQKRADAAEKRRFPAPPKTGGPAKKSDFKKWVR